MSSKGMTRERWDAIAANAKGLHLTAICLNINQLTDMMKLGVEYGGIYGDALSDEQDFVSMGKTGFAGTSCKVFVSKFIAPGCMRATGQKDPACITKPGFDSRWGSELPIDDWITKAGETIKLIEEIEKTKAKDIASPKKQSSIGTLLGIGVATLLGAGLAAMKDQGSVRVSSETETETDESETSEEHLALKNEES